MANKMNKIPNWICPNLPDQYKEHPRCFFVDTWSRSGIGPDAPRICFIAGTITPLLRPIEYPQFYPPNDGDTEFLIDHLIDNIEDARNGRCNHSPGSGPNLLIAIRLTDGDSLLFYPCEVVNLLGEEKAERILSDLSAECRQVLEMIKESGN